MSISDRLRLHNIELHILERWRHGFWRSELQSNRVSRRRAGCGFTSTLLGTAGVPGYTVTTAGTGSMVLTRKYIPTWAIVVAIIGLLLFLLGILALLFKETETLAITLVPEGDCTKVTISGVGSQEMLARISAVLRSMPVLDPNQARQLPPPPGVPVASVAVDSKTCPACAEDVKLAAQVCKHCGHKFEDQPVSYSADS